MNIKRLIKEEINKSKIYFLDSLLKIIEDNIDIYPDMAKKISYYTDDNLSKYDWFRLKNDITFEKFYSTTFNEINVLSLISEAFDKYHNISFDEIEKIFNELENLIITSDVIETNNGTIFEKTIAGKIVPINNL